VAKTRPDLGAKGTSLLLLERGMPGFEKGKRLKKVGMKAQDTSELFFNDVKVPVDNLLGGPPMENKGFVCLMEQLPWERIQIALGATAKSQAAIDWTVTYVKERKVFGQPVGNYQNTRYVLAGLQAQVQAARVFVDKCMELLLEDALDTDTASMAKLMTTELQCKVMDECVQLYGGYGYMWEYPIARAYADARVSRLYGGTSEIMKEVISRGMGLSGR
jgi:alkylation response protein AidB-like acyl-CoA dehydrogenase